MLPTPDTSHVPYSLVYEPSEDSFLLLDTLSSPSETLFLRSRLTPTTSSLTPLVLEVGSGSGVVIAFVRANATAILGTPAVLCAAVDANPFACAATAATIRANPPAPSSSSNISSSSALFLGSIAADLASPWRPRTVDLLIFNPPYVPTESLPPPPGDEIPPHIHLVSAASTTTTGAAAAAAASTRSYLLSLSYAGGRDGTEVTYRLIAALPDLLSPRGCAYILLCASNHPADVCARIERLGPGWRAVAAGEGQRVAGRENLVVVRAWRHDT